MRIFVEDLLRKIKIIFISTLPMIIIYVLMMFYLAPKHIGGLSGVMPLIHLSPIFIWAVIRPEYISFFMLAIAGLMVDVGSALPFGLSALGYTLFLSLIISQRRYIQREGFAAMCGYFALAAFVLQIFLWAGCSLFYSQLMPVATAFWQWLFTALLYPLLHSLFYPLIEKLELLRYRLRHS